MSMKSNISKSYVVVTITSLYFGLAGDRKIRKYIRKGYPGKYRIYSCHSEDPTKFLYHLKFKTPEDETAFRLKYL